MTAMTWWDHETQSIWSQPWGRAIRGTYKGVELFLLPSQVTSWESWRTEHPDTLAMINDMQRLGSRRQTFSPDFVIGLLLAGEAKAYYFRDAAMQGVINDRLGPAPIVVWAQEDNFHAYIRQVGERTLTFSLDGEALVDDETGSIWDIARGRAVEGPLSGEVLQPVPGSTAFDWAWEDFYPDTTFYTP